MMCLVMFLHPAHNLYQLQIHDELSWEFSIDDDPAEIFAFKKIMQDWQDGCVPIVADLEVTTATWADKKEAETLDEVQTYLST